MGKRILKGLLYLLGGALLLSIASVLAMRWVNPFTSAFMLNDRIAAKVSGDSQFVFRQVWVPIEAISAPMQLAVIASEDQKFPDHFGFDLDSIGDAWDAREHRQRGASTITQQVAKNLFLWRGPSWIRKGIEAYFTLLIESLWPKKRVLEVYLNIVELGRGTYGVEAASRLFYNKPAARLNSADAALFAAVLPNPIRLKIAAPSAYVRSRQTWILAQMTRLGGPAFLRNID